MSHYSLFCLHHHWFRRGHRLRQYTTAVLSWHRFPFSLSFNSFLFYFNVKLSLTSFVMIIYYFYLYIYEVSNYDWMCPNATLLVLWPLKNFSKIAFVIVGLQLNKTVCLVVKFTKLLSGAHIVYELWLTWIYSLFLQVKYLFCFHKSSFTVFSKVNFVTS